MGSDRDEIRHDSKEAGKRASKAEQEARKQEGNPKRTREQTAQDQRKRKS